MGYHSFRDSLSCALSGVTLGLSGKKFFSRNAESLSLKDTLDAVTIKVPSVDKIGTFAVEADTPAGKCSPAIHVLQWKGPDVPFIIFHHWSNEQPVDHSARKIFLNARYPFNANIVLVQAAFHDAPGQFQTAASDLSAFTSMVMTSVALIEELVGQFTSGKKVPVYVCGIKLGGWVTNLHHAFYNSAKAYLPVMAGAGFGDIFFDSSFSSSVSSLAKRSHQKVRRILNFDDLFMSTGNHGNIYPLLAKYDKVSRYHRQKTCFGDIPIAVMNKGHFTGAASYGDIRNHIFRSIERVKR